MGESDNGNTVAGRGPARGIRESVTLEKANEEMIRILEEVLPTRFGGSPLDYQLVEEEDDLGLTRLSIVVDPKIEIARERDVIESVLNAVEESVEDEMTRALWSQAEKLRVKRMNPILTDRGKMIPLRRLQHSKSSTDVAVS